MEVSFVVLLRHVTGATERLDHPDADRAFLGEGGEVALLVLDPARHHDVLLLETHREVDDRDRGRRDDEAERPVHVEQDARHHDELGDVDDQEKQAETAEPPDAGQVGGDPREQLAGLPVAVECHRQLLEPFVEVVPDRGLDAEHRVGLNPAAPEDEGGL